MFSFRTFMTEARYSPEALKLLYPSLETSHDLDAQHKNSSDIIDHFTKNADPTRDKKYTGWIVKRYAKKTLRQDQAQEINDTLSNFEKYKNKLTNRDINSYGSLEDLKSAVAPHIGSLSGKQQKRKIKDEGAELVHDDKEGTTVHKILNPGGACTYGSGTKWCTNSEDPSHFEMYDQQGHLYVIHTKDGRKYQYHPFSDTNELKDEKNKDVKPASLTKKYPELKNISLFHKAHPAFFPGNATQALEIAPDDNYRAEVFKTRKDLTSKDLLAGLQHPDPEIRQAVLENPNATQEHISVGLQDKEGSVRGAALRNKNVSPEQLTQGLYDSGSASQPHIAAASNPKTPNEEILKNIHKPHVRFGALQNPNISPEIVKAISSHEGNSFFGLSSTHPKVKQMAKNLGLSENVQLIERNMITFKQYFEYINEEKDDSGSLTSYRGKLNELAFVHAFDRYHKLLQHYGDHETAINALMNEHHLSADKLDKDHEFKPILNDIENNIGHKETSRTLADSHHAALATINYIHKTSGGITSEPTWAGPDTSGKTAERVAGYNSPADMLVNTKNGWHHISLKYSAGEKDKPTKLTQLNGKKLVEHVQKAYLKNFGKRDENLDAQLEALHKGYSSSGLNDENVAKKLIAAGIKPNANGEFAKNKIKDLGRYASNLVNGTDNKPGRHDKFRKELADHFAKNGIPEEEHEKHIKNLADVYDNVVKSGKKGSGSGFMDAFHNAIKRVYTEGTSGQHEMFKNLFNINPPGKGKVLVVKTKRSNGEEGVLPKISLGDHSRSLDKYLEKEPETEMYDSVKTSGTSTSTIKKRGEKHNLGRLSLDTGKSSPQIIGMAGKGIDHFESIDEFHPSKDKNLGDPPAVATAAVQREKQPEKPRANPTMVGLSNAEKYRRVVKPAAVSNPITSKPRPGIGGRPKPAKEPSWNDFHPEY